MKSVNHHVNKNFISMTLSNFVLLFLLRFFVEKNYIIKQLLTGTIDVTVTIDVMLICLSQYWYSQVDITSWPMPQ